MNERELIDKLKNNDHSAFDELVNKYGGAIYKIAVLMANNEEQAEDLFQETFIRAFSSVHRFKGSSSLYTWLYKILSNLNNDLLRKKYIAKKYIFKLIPDETTNPEHTVVETIDKNNSQKNVRKVLKFLPILQREVIILRFFEELKLSEIAERQNISIGTVKSRLYKALDKIKFFVNSNKIKTKTTK